MCNDPEGAESDTEQDLIWVDQTTSDLFRSGGIGRHAAFLFGKGVPERHRDGAMHDLDLLFFPCSLKG